MCCRLLIDYMTKWPIIWINLEKSTNSTSGNKVVLRVPLINKIEGVFRKGVCVKGDV